MGSPKDLFLAIDVGTGSIRASLVDSSGEILVISSREHEQIVPRAGWSEQRPSDWWTGVVVTVREVLQKLPGADKRVGAIAACGQMHGTVLLDGNGDLALSNVPLWNDKRTVDLVKQFEASHEFSTYAERTANPPTPAWPGFKLQWLKQHEPAIYRSASAFLMPKDYVNFRLTGEIATDWSEASCSFLMDAHSKQWSADMIDMLGLNPRIMPDIRAPGHVLGTVDAAAASDTGLMKGTPVLVGAADFAMALLGSGASRPGLSSEVMGTSSIITAISDNPILNEDLCNIATVEGNWGAFSLLESGGDAMRWARRAFHDQATSYRDIVGLAETIPPGANALFFLPYLTGERLGRHRNSRSQLFGISAVHTLPHVHRAVMEGVGFAVARQLRTMQDAAGVKLERVIASGGGAKTELWLKIKASIYGLPILVPRQQECGLVGCAAVAATAMGLFSRVEDAVGRFVRFDHEVQPIPEWQDVYVRMQLLFNKLYQQSQLLYDDLDALPG
jgi:xylulokinase